MIKGGPPGTPAIFFISFEFFANAGCYLQSASAVGMFSLVHVLLEVSNTSFTISRERSKIPSPPIIKMNF